MWDIRTHVVLSDDLVREIDELVGPRKRSEFLEKAAQELIRRERQTWAVEHGAGILRKEDYPGWGDSDMVLAWVRADRRGQSWLTTEPPPPDWRKFLDEE